MKHISELLDIGIGKRCLIVGGGDSLNRFEWDKLNDVYVICLNNHISQMADMIIYYDTEMTTYFNKHVISDETILIGFRHRDSLDHTVERCNYYYTYEDMTFGDSGFHSLQFADKIFNFGTIYLVGYDYETKGKSYHYNEDVSDQKKLERFKTWNIGKVLPRYTEMKWNNKIFNCNEKSKLGLFNYGLPY